MSGIIRVEPRSEVDLQLLEYMRSTIEPEGSCTPATFPLPVCGPFRPRWQFFSSNPYEQDHDILHGFYFFLGHESKTVVFRQYIDSWSVGWSKSTLLDVNERLSKEEEGINQDSDKHSELGGM